jgi:hypothetical protein
VTKSVERRREGNVIILLNKHLQTDRILLNNKTGIIKSNNKKGNVMLTGVSNFSGEKCD